LEIRGNPSDGKDFVFGVFSVPVDVFMVPDGNGSGKFSFTQVKL